MAKGGDIIIEALGVPIDDAQSIFKVRKRFNTLSPGDPFTVVILREGARLKLKGSLPDSER